MTESAERLEREAFEAWARTKGFDTTLKPYGYESLATEAAHMGWTEAFHAARRAPAEAGAPEMVTRGSAFAAISYLALSNSPGREQEALAMLAAAPAEAGAHSDMLDEVWGAELLGLGGELSAQNKERVACVLAGARAIRKMSATGNDDGAIAESGAPSGWKLVPVEPTVTMLRVGEKWHETWMPNAVAAASNIYRGMLAAAPAAPKD